MKRLPKQEFAQIGYDDAESIALAYMTTFGRISEKLWSSVHGAPIDAAKLRACGRVLFAESAYDLGASAVPLELRNAVAGQFIQHFCDSGGKPQVLVTVSESATTLRILRDGRLEFSGGADGANAVFAQGIPREVRGDFAVVSAERAANEVANRTGRRVASVPRLLRAPCPHSPAFSRSLLGHRG